MFLLDPPGHAGASPEVQLWILKDNVGTLLDAAIAAQVKEQIIALTKLLDQLENPREVRDRAKGFRAIAQEQVLGK